MLSTFFPVLSTQWTQSAYACLIFKWVLRTVPRLMHVFAWAHIHGYKWTPANKNEWNKSGLTEVWKKVATRGVRMLKLKSSRGELLMQSHVPSNATSKFPSYMNARIHTRTRAQINSCNPQLFVQTGKGLLVSV